MVSNFPTARGFRLVCDVCNQKVEFDALFDDPAVIEIGAREFTEYHLLPHHRDKDAEPPTPVLVESRPKYQFGASPEHLAEARRLARVVADEQCALKCAEIRKVEAADDYAETELRVVFVERLTPIKREDAE